MVDVVVLVLVTSSIWVSSGVGIEKLVSTVTRMWPGWTPGLGWLGASRPSMVARLRASLCAPAPYAIELVVGSPDSRSRTWPGV